MRAEEAALQAQQGVQVEEARVEDQVRAADRVDPDVDTRSEEYHPTAPATDPTYDGTVTDENTTVDPAHDQETAPRRTDPA